MKSVLFRKIATVRRLGLLRALRIALDRLFLRALARIFHFHRWHAEAPTSARPYRNTVGRLVNELKPRSVVEVGCGLGSILSRVQAAERYGYDIDEAVIRAARFLRCKKITFLQGSLSAVSLKRIDVLILVNWIHEIAPESLGAQIAPLLPRVRFLLLDAIDADGPSGYRYKHDFAFLQGKARRISITRSPNEERSFHLFEVLQ